MPVLLSLVAISCSWKRGGQRGWQSTQLAGQGDVIKFTGT